MRPLVSGRGTFWRIVANMHHAINYMAFSVRMNVDTENFEHSEDLLRILADQGFTDKITVYIGQLVGVNDGIDTPSATYGKRCFTNAGYAAAQQRFADLALRYGSSNKSLPTPTGAPCTAVRANGLIVGGKGELYKCYESVGNRLEVIGDIPHYEDTNGRLAKWLKYDPFENHECRACIALPVCMGGCAHHAMDPNLYSNRCNTFRHTRHEQVLRFVETAERARSADSRF